MAGVFTVFLIGGSIAYGTIGSPQSVITPTPIITTVPTPTSTPTPTVLPTLTPSPTLAPVVLPTSIQLVPTNTPEIKQEDCKAIGVSGQIAAMQRGCRLIENTPTPTIDLVKYDENFKMKYQECIEKSEVKNASQFDKCREQAKEEAKSL